MVSVRASTLIASPVERVFQFVGLDFFENYRRWSPEVKSLTRLSSGSIRVGFLARQIRFDHGHRSESVFRVTVLDRPNGIEFEETDRRFRIGYRIEPAADLARLTLRFDLHRLDFHLRPFARLVRSACQDSADRAVQNIRTLIEVQTPREHRALVEAPELSC